MHVLEVNKKVNIINEVKGNKISFLLPDKAIAADIRITFSTCRKTGALTSSTLSFGTMTASESILATPWATGRFHRIQATFWIYKIHIDHSEQFKEKKRRYNYT